MSGMIGEKAATQADSMTVSFQAFTLMVSMNSYWSYMGGA